MSSSGIRLNLLPFVKASGKGRQALLRASFICLFSGIFSIANAQSYGTNNLSPSQQNPFNRSQPLNNNNNQNNNQQQQGSTQGGQQNNSNSSGSLSPSQQNPFNRSQPLNSNNNQNNNQQGNTQSGQQSNSNTGSGTNNSGPLSPSQQNPFNRSQPLNNKNNNNQNDNQQNQQGQSNQQGAAADEITEEQPIATEGQPAEQDQTTQGQSPKDAADPNEPQPSPQELLQENPAAQQAQPPAQQQPAAPATPPAPPQNADIGAGFTGSTSKTRTSRSNSDFTTTPQSEESGVVPPEPDAPPPLPEPPKPKTYLENLPNIKARSYNVTVAEVSGSLRTYLFDDGRSIKPRVGKIILLRDGNQNVMAFRVIKSYFDRRQFAATRVRKYGESHFLEKGDSYTALEKIADLVPIPDTEQEEATEDDLEEIEEEAGIAEEPELEEEPIEGEELEEDEEFVEEPEGEFADDEEFDDSGEEDIDPIEEAGETIEEDELPEILAYDPELDAGISPAPIDDLIRRLDEKDLDSVDPSEFSIRNILVEEEVRLEKFEHWLSATPGVFRNLDADGLDKYFFGFGFRFGTNVQSQIFVDTAETQDSLSIEGGIFQYTVVGNANASDSYFVVPVAAVGRYNLYLGEGFVLFMHGGIIKNFVIASDQGTAQATENLSSFIPSIGGGFFIRIGPQWRVRADIGTGHASAGLTLRF